MAGEINFGLLDTRAPERAGNALYEGQQRAQQSALAAAQLQGAQRQNKLADLAMAQDESAQQAFQAAGGDPAKLQAEYQRRGLFKQFQDLQKQQLDAEGKRATIGKDKSVADKNNQEIDDKKRVTAAREILGLDSPEAVRAKLAADVQSGTATPEHATAIINSLPANPGEFGAWKNRLLMNMLTPKEQVDTNLNREKFGYQQKNDAENRGVQIRGQNISAGNARASREQSERHFQTTNGQGKVPTEFQGKSAGYGARAEQADKIISELGDKYSPAAINTKQGLGQVWGVGGALEAGANVFLGENSQKAEQAQRDFINAVLRQESGAAIADTEFANAKRQYFPQPGDSQGVIKQKSANRKLAIQGFQNNAGRAAFSAPEASGDIHSQADAILGKK